VDEKKHLHIYPNPANEQLFISSYRPVSGQVLITITNINGQQIQQFIAGEGKEYFTQILETSEWKAGIYFVNLSSVEETITEKIIIAH
jgi:hypothetical protein